jgi:hypothetical protein
LLAILALFERFNFATKNYGQAKIALPGLENHLPAFQAAPRPERVKEGELSVINLGKSNRFGVPIKLFVIVDFDHCN